MSGARKNDSNFGFHDLAVFVLFVVGSKSLPGQLALQKIHKDVAKGFEVVTTTLLHSQVIAEGSVTRRSRQTLVLAVTTVKGEGKAYGMCVFVRGLR